MPRVPPTYRERLRREGSVLAASGVAGSVLLLAVSDESTRHPASTVGQLVVVTVLLALLGPLAARRALDSAPDVGRVEAGSGQPTALWALPVVVVALTGAVGALAGWDAGLRVACGCLLVGLAQAFVIERVVAARERQTGGRYVRLAGSRIVRGTRLGHLPD
jgi:hypothetical protein